MLIPRFLNSCPQPSHTTMSLFNLMSVGGPVLLRVTGWVHLPSPLSLDRGVVILFVFCELAIGLTASQGLPTQLGIRLRMTRLQVAPPRDWSFPVVFMKLVTKLGYDSCKLEKRFSSYPRLPLCIHWSLGCSFVSLASSSHILASSPSSANDQGETQFRGLPLVLPSLATPVACHQATPLRLLLLSAASNFFYFFPHSLT